MSRLGKLLDRQQVKASLSFGGSGGFTQPPFWSWSDARDMLFSGSVGKNETIEASFADYVEHAYKANGPIFTCVLVRALPFSEARFAYQRLERGRPTDLFGDQSLAILEQPWVNGTTGELLWRMEQDASLAGNCFLTLTSKGAIRRLRPDWMTIVSGITSDPEASPWELESELVGYIYEPKPMGGGRRPDPVFLSPDRVVHYSPIPDPIAQWRGMSWITPVAREVQADLAATNHKYMFFKNGATPGLIIRYAAGKSPDDVARYKAAFDAGHRGVDNAYSALHLGGGADVTVAGVDLRQLEFKLTQGAGETRLAAAAGVGAIIARFSEGMAGSSLNQGNYSAAIRQFTDLTLRPMWRTAAGALSKFTSPPPGTRLWYDTRDVALLHESATDEADVLSKNAQSLRALLDAGFDPDAAIRAVDAGDISLLTGTHSGLFSVQLQPAGANNAPPGSAP